MTSPILASLARLLGLVVVLCGGVGVAAPSVVAPPDRLVIPGEYVTLVFGVRSDVDGEAEVRIDTREGFRVLRRTDRLAADAGRVVPLAVTVEVPDDAPAGLEEIVRVAVELSGARAEAEVRLTVAELRELRLEVPDPFVLDDDAAAITVRNAGNVTLDVRLELFEGGTLVDADEARIPADGAAVLDVRPTRAGIHELRLEGGVAPLRRPWRVVRLGPPEPDPPVLSGSVAFVADVLEPRFGVEASLQGPVSDFVLLDVLASSNVRRSFAELRGQGRGAAGSEPAAWRARVGATGRPPFDLALPDLVGGSVRTGAAGWDVALAAGDGDGALAAYVAGRRSLEGASDARGVLAAGGGFDDGGPRLALRGDYEAPRTSVVGEARYRDGTLDAHVLLEGVDLRDDTRMRAFLRLDGALGSDPELRLEGSARAANLDAVSGRLVVGLAAADARWRVGATFGLPSELPGRLRQRLQLGSDASHALLQHDLALSDGWQSQTSFGVVADAGGGALRASSSVLGLVGPSTSVHGYADVQRSLGDGAWSGSLAARGELQLDAIALRASGSWRPAEGTVDLAAGGEWTLAGSELSLDLGTRAETGSPRSFGARLEGRYAFAFPVPQGIVDAMGGRRLGTIEVVVTAAEGPLEGIVVRVGEYRLRTDREGRATALLEPGRYEVRLDGDALPIEYAAPRDGSRTVVVEQRRSRTVAFRAVRTGTLRGRILMDSDGDGVADVPAKGAAGRVLLIEPSGVVRDLEVAPDGAFEARGLRPGTIELRLVGLPVGSGVVGPSELRLRVEATSNELAIFLVRPPSAFARSFGGDAPRIADVALQAERVPPGSAPLVTATLVGEADEVLVEADDRAWPMRVVDGVWRARVIVPDDATSGVLPVTVTARSEAGERTRRAQLVIDPDVPLVRLEAAGPVEPGGALEVRLSVLATVAHAEIRSPAAEDAGRTVPLTSTRPDDGSLVGELFIASDAADAVYEVTVTGTLDDGRAFESAARFRVLAR